MQNLQLAIYLPACGDFILVKPGLPGDSDIGQVRRAVSLAYGRYFCRHPVRPAAGVSYRGRRDRFLSSFTAVPVGGAASPVDFAGRPRTCSGGGGGARAQLWTALSAAGRRPPRPVGNSNAICRRRARIRAAERARERCAARNAQTGAAGTAAALNWVCRQSVRRQSAADVWTRLLDGRCSGRAATQTWRTVDGTAFRRNSAGPTAPLWRVWSAAPALQRRAGLDTVHPLAVMEPAPRALPVTVTNYPPQPPSQMHNLTMTMSIFLIGSRIHSRLS